MFNLRAIAWKLCKGAKTHVLTSISIIAVAICLIVTMVTYIHNAKSSLDETIEQQYGQMDLLAGFDYGQGQTISHELYEQVQLMEEVQAVSPVSLEMTTVEQLESVYTLGVENDALVKSRYHFEQDVSKETMIVSELLADTLQVKLGDTVMWNNQPRTIIEVLPTPMGAEPFQMAIVHNDAFTNSTSKVLFMLIETDERDAVVSNLLALQDGLRIDIVAEYDFVKMNVQNLFVFMIILSAFILLISGLLLLSTMQLLFAKINGQLMILRSLGASSIQIMKLVRMQLILIVSLGLVFGTFLSVVTIRVALPKMIEWMQLPEASTDIPALLMFTVVASVGALLTGYMLLQMKKAMHILPLQLSRTQQYQPFTLKKWKMIVVGIVTIIALLLMFVGQLGGDGKGALQILVGSLLLAFVVLYLIPFAFQWLLKGTLQPIRMLFGKEAYLACQQLIPQVRVNIKIVLSLVALIVILVFGSSMLKSIESNEQAYLEERFTTDFILSNASADRNALIESISPLQQSSLFDVQKVESLGTTIAMTYDGMGYDLFAEDLTSFGVEERLDNKIVITENFAHNEQLKIGDIINPYVFNREVEDLQQQGLYKVAAIIPSENPYIGAYVDWTSDYAQSHLAIREVKVNTTDKPALEQFVQQHPMFHVLEKQEALSQSETMFNQRWSLFIGVFVVLLMATTIGIIQTLWHLVYTNRSQYTIQRMLGLSPNGLVKYLCMQVLTFTLYGLFNGFIIGALLTSVVKLIDQEGSIGFDYVTIGLVSGGLLFLLLIVFGLHGVIMSKRKLSEEILQL